MHPTTQFLVGPATGSPVAGLCTFRLFATCDARGVLWACSPSGVLLVGLLPGNHGGPFPQLPRTRLDDNNDGSFCATGLDRPRREEEGWVFLVIFRNLLSFDRGL